MLIKDICSSLTDGSHNPPQGISESSFLMLSSKNVFDDNITFDEPRFLSKEDFEKENKRTNIKTGDILLTIVGTVGRSAVVTADLPPFTLQRSVAVLHPNIEVCNERYLMYALQGRRSYIENRAKGVAQKGIYLKEVAGIDIPVPAKDVQNKIVAKLDKVNLIIKYRRTELLKLDELVKARFVELMDSAELSDELTVEQITERVKVGFVGTCEKYYTDDTGIPMLRTGNITDHGVDMRDLKYVTADFHAKNKKSQIRQGDLLIARHGSNGQANVYDGPEAQCLNAVVIVPNQAITKSVFLAGLINSPKVKEQIDRTLVGSTQHVVNTKSIANLVVRIPCLEVQEQYEAFVEQVDKSKFAVQKALDEAQTLFDSLMQEYFG